MKIRVFLEDVGAGGEEAREQGQEREDGGREEESWGTRTREGSKRQKSMERYLRKAFCG